jgi:hypothetical protein
MDTPDPVPTLKRQLAKAILDRMDGARHSSPSPGGSASTNGARPTFSGGAANGSPFSNSSASRLASTAK